MKLFIEKSKTDICGYGSWLFISCLKSVICPVQNLRRYLSYVKIHDNSEEFVFRRVTIIKNDNQIFIKTNAALSYSRAQDTNLEALEAIGCDKSLFSTHSLHSSGAT